MPEGIILKGVGGLYSVKSEGMTYLCKPRGLFRMQDIKPVPGDRVIFEITDNDHEGYLNSISKRTNYLVRPAVSNIDQAILVIAAKEPSPDLLLLDKLICLCESKDIVPVICINKTDLAEAEDVRKIELQYAATGYVIIKTSIKNSIGMEELENTLKGKTNVLAGQSGVGKSTILNTILKEIKMETGIISKKLGTGKHTTRHAEFLEINGGYLVDTPGFSNFDAGLLDYDCIKEYFVEFEQFEGTCRFNGCIHVNEPDCSVKDAIKSGTIDSERHKRYIEILNLTKQAQKDKRGY
ncbi:MAG: ribosome small subunit-dependent GTPase A [Clostridia bacterium]|nr:ribosome small subunit-dependent GTPase A [Clostridia bacterium]